MKDNWENYRLRIISEAKRVLKNNKSNGLAIITSHMIVDSDGNPIAWLAPSCKRVEPTKDTANVVATVLEALTS